MRDANTKAPEPPAELSSSLQRLAARGVARTYPKGYRLIEEGDISQSIYIIIKGRVRVFASGSDGREVTFGTYGPGEYVGEMSLDGGPRSASVVTIEPIDCVMITRQTLLHHLSEDPGFALELISKVIRRARAATLSTRQLALNDVYGRLVLLLNELSQPFPDGTRRIGRRVTHLELANNLGCSREMVGRIMRDLEKGNYLIRGDAEFVMLRALPMRW